MSSYRDRLLLAQDMPKIAVRRLGRRSLRQSARVLAKRENSFDLWLVRLSYLSQFGLFALTIAALYFTVIPLYKTAALEERIAKHEAELRDAEEHLAAAKKTLAEVKERSYVRERAELVNGFIRRAGPSCSGLLRPLEPLLKLGEKRVEKPMLDIDVGECLLAELKEVKPDEKLRPADSRVLLARIEALSQNLEKERWAAKKKIEAVPISAAADKSTWAEKGYYQKEFEEFALKAKQVFPNANWDRIELENAIHQTQRAIANTFEEKVRVEVLNLRSSIVWPKNDG